MWRQVHADADLADLRGGFQHLHIPETGRRQTQGGGEAADAGAGDNYPH